MKLTLSVLDQSPVRCDGTAAEALRESVELAKAAERLGYARYWVSEHHNSAGFAGAAPEILIGQLAAATSTISRIVSTRRYKGRAKLSRCTWAYCHCAPSEAIV